MSCKCWGNIIFNIIDISIIDTGVGIEEDNLGCFDGKKWCGSGAIHYSINPSNGKVKIPQ